MALTTKRLLSTGLLAATLSLALSSAACGPIVPVSPTWKDDIRPLMVSRCIRCHSASFRVDPSVKPPLPVIDPAMPSFFNFDFATFGEIPQLNLDVLKMAPQYCTTKGMLFMPPPPAEALEDWQIDMLEAWSVYPQ
jgi:hypothetical protein